MDLQRQAEAEGGVRRQKRRFFSAEAIARYAVVSIDVSSLSSVLQPFF